MLVKIVESCKVALKPHLPQLSFAKDVIIDLSDEVAKILLDAKKAVLAPESVKDEKELKVEVKNKSFGHSEKINNK